ncbi:MAG: hypothetical protein U0Y10_14620 [Spirosomataceae bacterium]
MKIFSRNFTLEDLLLYIVCMGLLCFVGSYFWEVTTNLKGELNAQEMKQLNQLAIQPTPNAQDNVDNNYFRAQLQLIYKQYDFRNKYIQIGAVIKFSGFLVGALLSILGMMVVVRGVRTGVFDVEASAYENARVKLTSSSPGIFLVFAGTLIIISTIVRGFETSTTDININYPGVQKSTNEIPLDSVMNQISSPKMP